jgi:hypothetical protein
LRIGVRRRRIVPHAPRPLTGQTARSSAPSHLGRVSFEGGPERPPAYDRMRLATNRSAPASLNSSPRT